MAQLVLVALVCFTGGFLLTHMVCRSFQASRIHVPALLPQKADLNPPGTYVPNQFGIAAHLDGIDWYDSPVPPRSHRCWVQTKNMRGDGFFAEMAGRCACGSTIFTDGGVIEKNSRKQRSST